MLYFVLNCTGKTSLFQALLRFYCYHGTILVNDINLANMTVEHARQLFGWIPQESVLLGNTLAEALFGYPNISRWYIQYFLLAIYLYSISIILLRFIIFLTWCFDSCVVLSFAFSNSNYCFGGGFRENEERAWEYLRKVGMDAKILDRGGLSCQNR